MSVGSKEEIATLRGLDGVFVVVENIHAQIGASGLTRELLLADAEERLRQAAIRSISEEEGLKAREAAALCIFLALIPSEYFPEMYAYVSRVTLQQLVLLMRDKTIAGDCTTWEITSTGIVRADSLLNLRQVVTDHVDRFIADFKAANEIQ
jgi:hypothetical protein